MNFDISKENIQPLRAGRNMAQLEVALQAQSDPEIQRELQSKQLLYEKEIEEYTGEDPLELWYNYISWTEQSFPKQGHEGKLAQILERCLATFENDPRYSQDRRFCRLWIKYIDLKNKPLEIFQLMHSKNLCTMCSDFYRAWAFNYEINSDFRLANLVIELGLKNFAQPYEELALAHQSLMSAIVDSVLKRNNSQNTRLADERKALTSLRSFKQGNHFVAPNIRIGQNIISMTPGILPSSSMTNSTKPPPVKAFTDENHETELFLNKNTNPNFSIIDSVKNKENQIVKEVLVKSDGTWSNKKMKKIIQSSSSKSPPLKVYEDVDQDKDMTMAISTIDKSEEDSFLKEIHLPPNFCNYLNDAELKNWKVAVFISEPPDPRRKVMYCRERIYRDNTEYSFEENLAERWFKNQKAMLNNLENISMDCEMTKRSSLEEDSPKVVENVTKSLNTSLSINKTTTPQSFKTVINLAAKPSSAAVSVITPVSNNSHQQQQQHLNEENTTTTTTAENSSQSKLSQEVFVKKALIFGQNNESLTVHTKDVLSKINECWSNNLSATITTGGIPPEEIEEEEEDIVEIEQPAKTTVFEIHEDTVLNERSIQKTVIKASPIKSKSPFNDLHSAKKRKPLQDKEMSSSSSQSTSRKLSGNGFVEEACKKVLPLITVQIPEDEVIEVYENVEIDDLINMANVKTRKPLQVREMSSSSQPLSNSKNRNFLTYREVEPIPSNENETITVEKIDVIDSEQQQQHSNNLKRSEVTDIVFNQPLLTSTQSKRESIITGFLSTKSKVSKAQILNLDDTCLIDKMSVHPEAASTPFTTNAKSRITKISNNNNDINPNDKLPSIFENKECKSNSNLNAVIAQTISSNCDKNVEQLIMLDNDINADPKVDCMRLLQTELSKGPVNPFSCALRNRILNTLGFPWDDCDDIYVKLNSIPRLSRKETIIMGNDHFQIEKSIGKGNFGSVFKAAYIERNKIVALKYQKPSRLWELYIMREVQQRLINPNLRHAYMDVDIAFFSPNASVFVSNYSKFGSLLDVRNAVRKSMGKSLSEGVVLYFASEILRIVEALHNTKIIHADLKPDNFLVMRLPPESGRLSLQLIDFGSSIDMSLFPDNIEFYASVTTEDFICSEMRENRPWTYQTDFYCLAATVYCLLFEKYMQVRKLYDSWTLTQVIPRYMKTDIWNEFFSQLLNVPSSFQKPDLKNLRQMIDNAQVSDDDLAKDFRSILNILKKR